MAQRRSRLDIIYDILGVISEKGRIKPTRLMYKANMSHKSLNSYLEELKGKGMVEETTEKEHRYLSITAKGIKFLREFKGMKDFQEAFGL